MDITQLLEFSVQQGASDLHLSTGQPPILRIDGDVQRIDAANLDSEKLQTMIYDIMNDEQRRGFEAELESDFSFELPGIARFRANVFMHNRGIGGVFRTIPISSHTVRTYLKSYVP